MKGSKLFVFALAVLAALAAVPARAQQQVTPYGQQAIVMNAVTGATATPTGASATTCHPPVAPGNTCEIQSLGQNVHFLTYTTTGTSLIVDIRLEGSFDGTNFFAISADATNTTIAQQNGAASGALYGCGYFPFIRAHLVTLSGTSATLTALYSGTSAVGTSGCPLGTFNASQNLTRIAFPFNSPDTGAPTFGTVNAPFGNAYGTLFVYTSSLHSGGSVSAVALGVTATGGTTTVPGAAQILIPSQSLNTNANAWYELPLPYFPTQQLQVQFVSGGTSSGGLYAFIVFQPPQQDVGTSGVHITTATNTAVKSGTLVNTITGTFSSLTVNQVGSSGALATVYDGAISGGVCSGTVIATINVASQIGTFWFNQQFFTGLCVTTTGGTPADITVNYR